jgi:hypothetical protein
MARDAWVGGKVGKDLFGKHWFSFRMGYMEYIQSGLSFRLGNNAGD